MEEARRQPVAIVCGDGKVPEPEILEVERRGPIYWTHVRLKHEFAYRSDKEGQDPDAERVALRGHRTAWIGIPVRRKGLGRILPAHAVKALRRGEGPVEIVSIPPQVAPSCLAKAARTGRKPETGKLGGTWPVDVVARAATQQVTVTVHPEARVLVHWDDSPMAELASRVLRTRLEEAGLDPLGPVRALQEMAASLKRTITARLEQADDSEKAAALEPVEHIERLLAGVSERLDAFVHRWYGAGLPAVLPAEFREPPTGNPLDVRIPPLPRLEFLPALVLAAVQLAQLWTQWQLADDALFRSLFRAHGRRGGLARRDWDEEDFAAVSKELERGLRLKEACAARLRARGDRTTSPDCLARAYRRACEKDPKLARPRAGRRKGKAGTPPSAAKGRCASRSAATSAAGCAGPAATGSAGRT